MNKGAGARIWSAKPRNAKKIQNMCAESLCRQSTCSIPYSYEESFAEYLSCRGTVAEDTFVVCGFASSMFLAQLFLTLCLNHISLCIRVSTPGCQVEVRDKSVFLLPQSSQNPRTIYIRYSSNRI